MQIKLSVDRDRNGKLSFVPNSHDKTRKSRITEMHFKPKS